MPVVSIMMSQSIYTKPEQPCQPSSTSVMTAAVIVTTT